MPITDKLKEAGFSDLEIKEYTLKSAGFSDAEIKESALPSQELSFSAKHPNIYGVGGAIKETAKELTKFLPYVKYVYPEERKKFMKLSQQEQTRDQALQNNFQNKKLLTPRRRKSQIVRKRTQTMHPIPKTNRILRHGN